MKAIVYNRYGGPEVLELQEIDEPAPQEDEILVRVRAASVNPLDWHFMRGQPFLVRGEVGLRRPKNPRLGVDLAGVVEAVGGAVTQFRPGDEIFGLSRGAFGEVVCTQGKGLAPKPANLTFEESAAVPVAGLTALQGLRNKGRIQPGQKVLINGASGGVGTFAVQIAKAFGAEVTGVTSTKNLDLVRSLSADYVVDYTRENFTRSGARYDLVFDSVGNHSLFALRRVLSPEGSYVAVGGSLAHMATLFVMSRLVKQRLTFFVSTSSREDLLTLKELIEAEKIRPVIDRRYPLDEVPEALRYLGQGHARAKVVVAMGGGRGRLQVTALASAPLIVEVQV